MNRYHRWAGIVLSLFLLVFCLSGIVLNHRALVAGVDVPRSLLPKSYHIEGWNNGIVRGTLTTAPDSVIAYGCAGTWRTNRAATRWDDFNAGLPTGADRRAVRTLLQDRRGTLWCVTNEALYRHDGTRWQPFPLDHHDERLVDIALNADSTRLAVLSRARVYIIGLDQGGRVTERTLRAVPGCAASETLFRTVWKLHSGELFGLPGRLVVDAVALVLIVLSLTGIVLFFCPFLLKKMKRGERPRSRRRVARCLSWNYLWHNRVGRWTLVLTLFVTVTGTCLRPPYMIPLVLTKTAPLDGDKQNPFHDKLRAIRWDRQRACWLVVTANDFLWVDKDIRRVPVRVPAATAPVVSPMGVNVLRQLDDGAWLVGSFSGLYYWDTQRGVVVDDITGEPATGKRMGALGGNVVTGYSEDFATPQPVVFEYSRAANGMPPMPDVLRRQPLALWNVALELHVGRCYAPVLGPLSELFVSVFGTLIVLVVVSGYVVSRRRRRKKQEKKPVSQ